MRGLHLGVAPEKVEAGPQFTQPHPLCPATVRARRRLGNSRALRPGPHSPEASWSTATFSSAITSSTPRATMAQAPREPSPIVPRRTRRPRGLPADGDGARESGPRGRSASAPAPAPAALQLGSLPQLPPASRRGAQPALRTRAVLEGNAPDWAWPRRGGGGARSRRRGKGRPRFTVGRGLRASRGQRASVTRDRGRVKRLGAEPPSGWDSQAGTGDNVGRGLESGAGLGLRGWAFAG